MPVPYTHIVRTRIRTVLHEAKLDKLAEAVLQYGSVSSTQHDRRHTHMSKGLTLRIGLERINDGGGCYHLGYKPPESPFFKYPTHDPTCEKRVVTLPSYEVPDWDKQIVGVTVHEPDFAPWHNVRETGVAVVDVRTPRSIGAQTRPRVADRIYTCDVEDCEFWSYDINKAIRHEKRKGGEHKITTDDTL
jgi:hypothetical protein